MNTDLIRALDRVSDYLDARAQSVRPLSEEIDTAGPATLRRSDLRLIVQAGRDHAATE
jgi:hypothetical protein